MSQMHERWCRNRGEHGLLNFAFVVLVVDEHAPRQA